MTGRTGPADSPAGRDQPAPDRDRDPGGRPRNARPRDGLGRPLPKSAAGEPRVPDDLVLPPRESLELADQLMAAGRPFHAHEVLEASWKSAPPDERDLWQGLAQVAVGLTHAHRGNARGAVTLLRRGADRVRAYCDRMAPPDGRGHPYGIDTAAVLAACDELAARIELHGLAGMTVEDLRPPLLAAGPAAGR